MQLTTNERLILKRLGTNPDTALTRREAAEIIGVSLPTISGLLRSLTDKGYLAKTPNKRNTRFWKIKSAENGVVEIHSPTNTLDEAVANLQAKAAKADRLERILHTIANLLADEGIHIPLLASEEEEPEDEAPSTLSPKQVRLLPPTT